MTKLIRFPVDLGAAIAAEAARWRRSFTAQVIWWVERGRAAEREEQDRERGG